MGLSFAQFKIIKELGRGSYGVVYLVKMKDDIQNNQFFVLKKIKF